jgi:hypothetical protein
MPERYDDIDRRPLPVDSLSSRCTTPSSRTRYRIGFAAVGRYNEFET